MRFDVNQVLDAVPGMMVSSTSDGTVDFINVAWASFSGVDRTTTALRDWPASIGCDEPADFLEHWRRIVRSGNHGEIETTLRRQDGARRRFLIRCSPMRDKRGRVIRWQALATEYEREPSERLTERRILDDVPEGIVVLTSAGEIEAVNSHMVNYFAKSGQDIKQWTTVDLVHPDDFQNLIDTIRRAAATGDIFTTEHRLLGADGTYRWFQARAKPLRDADGDIVRWYAVHFDIDERKRSDDTFRTRELNLRNIINALPATAWSTRPDGFVDFLNDRWLNYAGMTREQAGGFGWADVIHPEDAAMLLEYWQNCLVSGDEVDVEARMRRCDGQYRWFLFRANPLRNESGEIIKWYGTNIDIEDRKRAEEKLRASEQNLTQIINTIPTLAWSTLPDGYTDFLHHRWLEYAGLTESHAYGWGWIDAIHPDDRPRLVANWQACLETGIPSDAEARVRRYDGEYRWFLFKGSPLRDEAGKIIKWYGANVDIEDRKRAEQALAESERQSRLIVDTIPGLVAIFGPDGEPENINEQFLGYLGQTFEDFRNWRENGTIHPDDLERHIERFARSLTSSEPMDFETRLKRCDGVYRWFHLRGNPARSPTGQITRWYCLMTDVDDRRRAEEAVRESEVNLRRIINTLPTTAWSTRPDGFVEFLSDRWLNYAGVTFEQAAGFGWGDVIHPDDQHRLFGYWQGCLVSGERVDIEARMRRYDGAYRWFLFRANPLRDADGAIVKWYGMNIDIEDRKHADEALRESERHSRLIVDTIPGMIALFTPEGELNGANHQLLEFFDKPLEEVRRWTANGMTHPDDLASFIDAFAASVRTGEPYEVETRLLRFDGEYRWFQIRGLPLRDGNGIILRWYGLLTDIDDRKRTEEELRRSEAFLADAQRVSRTGSFAWVLGSGAVTWSEETYRIYGFEPGVRVTLDLIRSRIHPDNLAAFQRVVDTAQMEGSDFNYKSRLIMADQSTKYVRVVAHNERNRDGELELRGAVRDVTASRLAEEALSKARSDLARVTRITSLGLLTASIAHEVNQPLAGIITNANACLHLLDNEPPNIEVAKQTARRTIRDGNRAADVIARLRALFSKNPAAIGPVDLNEAVREVIVLSRGDIQRGGLVLRSDLANNLQQVAGDRVQLQQVILNLIRNASEAMSGVSDRQRRLLIRTEPDNESVRFSIEDAGIGFVDDAERAFEAFYSTKIDGMGIGLSVSKSIVESHKGKLWAFPNDGPGVTVCFSIPIFVGSNAIATDVKHSDISGRIENSARI